MLTAAEINNNFQLLKDLMIADKIIFSVPVKMTSLLKEQRAETLNYIHDIGTAYYDAKREIFAIYSNLVLGYIYGRC